jgi:hypothetical protein
MRVIIVSTINLILGGGLVWPFNEDKNIYFHNEQDNDTSSDSYEKNYYNLDLDLLTMLY